MTLSGMGWGRQFALSLNLVLLFSHFVTRIGFYIFTAISYGEGNAVIDTDAVVVSIFSLLFIVILTRPHIKDFTVKKINSKDRLRRLHSFPLAHTTLYIVWGKAQILSIG